MTPELVLFCALAALLELDTTYAFQLTFSRGIIAGPLFAILTGNWLAGIQVGVFTELLFSDINPLGSILPPSAVVCCAVSMALNSLGIELCFAFVWGVIAAFLFAQAEQYMRKRRVGVLPVWENKIMQRPDTIGRVIALELFTNLLINFALISSFVWISSSITLWLMPHMSIQSIMACRFAYMAVPWIGLASLIPEFRLKKR
ncbi:MAG: PTS sugar transporter subunit IIC [Elusimicrobiaceae bacterium]|nr:PTS sugar transporter subunit IIC [Elusimicrobiaceae bacterium]